MAQENPTWGQARVAAELSVKLGICVSPRTVRAYWPPEPERRGNGRTCSQNWRTFVRNHAQSIVACDFLVVVTARFRTPCVPPHGGRDTAHRALQRHRASNGDLDLAAASRSDSERSILRFLIHDRDAIFSAEVDQQLKAFGLRVLRTPVRAPKAKDYASHCTSWVRCDTTSLARRRCDSVMPWAFRGGLSPGCSYKQWFLSLQV
jgi:putative transposase